MPTRLRLLATLLFVTVLAAVAAQAATGSATILWTAPGDDSLSGRATAYDLRWSAAPITTANFATATKVLAVPAPKPAGSAESFIVTNLTAGAVYYFALKTVDDAANWSALSNVVHATIGALSVDDSRTLWLAPPWPNPARGSAHWAYSLREAGPVTIDAFDPAGRHVASIARGWMGAGRGGATWDLRDDLGAFVAAGLYLIRVTYGGRTATSRLVVTH